MLGAGHAPVVLDQRPVFSATGENPAVHIFCGQNGTLYILVLWSLRGGHLQKRTPEPEGGHLWSNRTNIGGRLPGRQGKIKQAKGVGESWAGSSQLAIKALTLPNEREGGKRIKEN